MKGREYLGNSSPALPYFTLLLGRGILVKQGPGEEEPLTRELYQLYLRRS